MSGHTELSEDVDDEEDQAGGEVPMIVKTLKPTAEPGQYDKFIAEALVFYGLPPHQNIAQVRFRWYFLPNLIFIKTYYRWKQPPVSDASIAPSPFSILLSCAIRIEVSAI